MVDFFTELQKNMDSRDFRCWNKSELAWLTASCSRVIKTKRSTYFNIPAAFDIETSSFMDGGRKSAAMYIWQFGIFGRCVYGRTWPEFIDMLQALQDALHLGPDRRMIVYVHNLAFEFQFIRNWMEWPEVFALEERKPVKCFCEYGIEFRCSYVLTNESLAKVGRDLQHVKVTKLSGDLDYDLTRGSETDLTPQEMDYCLNDLYVVMALIAEKMVQDGNITKIPLTKTGYVRRYVRNECLYTSKTHKKTDRKKWKMYRGCMNALKITPKEYLQCKAAFQGGFTHACAYHSGKILQHVGSYDIASSYPAVICSELFPMSRGRVLSDLTPENVHGHMDRFCCLIDVELEGLQAVNFADHPISESKCRFDGPYQTDNGRVVYAEKLRTIITDVDYRIYRKFYDWDSETFNSCRYYVRGYLPSDFIGSVLTLYAAKTELKGVEGREVDYMQAKGNINSCYGMMVTDIARDVIEYGEDWQVSAPDLEQVIREYNGSKNRFLSYPWGVWVTAYARRNLFAAILECGSDYVYADTDSVKILNPEDHTQFFERYNRQIARKLRKMCDALGLEFEKTRPKDPKGRQRPLGIYEFEGIYDTFKTLGAKRYLTEKNGELQLTCAGVSKSAAGYIKTLLRGDLGPFRAFTNGLYIPPEHTGKLTHTYIDDPQQGILTDYNGKFMEYSERSSVHLQKADYSLSLARQYVDYLFTIQKEERHYE